MQVALLWSWMYLQPTGGRATGRGCWWKTGRSRGSPHRPGSQTAWTAAATEQDLAPCSLQRLWEDSQQLRRAENKPLLSSPLPCQPGPDSLSPAVSRSTSGWKGKQETPSPAGTQLPVVPGNDWTNRRCPAANPQSFQLQIQASQTKDGTALSESRDHFIISWARKKQTRTCCSLPLLKCYEKEKTIKL